MKLLGKLLHQILLYYPQELQFFSESVTKKFPNELIIKTLVYNENSNETPLVHFAFNNHNSSYGIKKLINSLTEEQQHEIYIDSLNRLEKLPDKLKQPMIDNLEKHFGEYDHKRKREDSLVDHGRNKVMKL